MNTGLLALSGFGNALQNATSEINRRRHQEQMLGLLAQKEGLEVDPESGEFRQSARGLLEQENARRTLESRLALEAAHADAYRAAARAARAKASGAMGGTPAQIAADKAYGKEYTEFTDKGANTLSTIDKIEALAKNMETVGDSQNEIFSIDEGGALAAMSPDFMKSRKMVGERDNSRNFANTTLKELFGGQLSDEERNAAAREYYNEALPRSENIKNLKQKVAELKRAYEAKKGKAEYFEKTGTLRGYQGSKVLEDLLAKIRPAPGLLNTPNLPEDPSAPVRVRSPKGKIKLVPRSQLKDALDNGGTVVQ